MYILLNLYSIYIFERLYIVLYLYIDNIFLKKLSKENLEAYSRLTDGVESALDEADKAQVQADLDALKALVEASNPDDMTDSQVDEIKAAREKLMESAQKLFAKMYEQTQQAGGQAGPDMNMGGGASQGGNEAGYGDDVVDADYKEV